jgi:phosphoenolpyruvate synthase/pyruvate phosphate dikinase
MFATLARARQAILELPWLPETRRLIEHAIRDTFGGDLNRGVFVRSDTNVEDLPQFSGAGLNLTVPHQTTLDGVLSSIRRVWTSPFSERAYLWRKQILEEQSRIYPSVLLLSSIPSDKSGVLITSGLNEGGPNDLTIAAAEGVGGAVEGEDAETVVVHPDGSVLLLSQAKAPGRRSLVSSEAGGVVTVPSRRPAHLLTDEDISQLRDVVNIWKSRFAAESVSVWDIEYGFVAGKLWLFQIRPFVRFRSSAILDRLRVLDGEAQRNTNRIVVLAEAA